MRVYRALGIALVVQASLALTACTPEAITAFTSIATVIVQPDTLDIDVDAHASLSAAGYNAYGLPMLGLPPTWSSTDPTIAQVTQTGDVVGIDTGVTTITATLSGKTGLSTVKVRRRVATVTVAPASAAVAPGQSVQLTETLRSASGQLITGRTVTWSSSSTTVATVSATGLVTALTPGVAVISATCEGKSGSATVTVNVTVLPVASVAVTPASAAIFIGGTAQLTATAKDANGNVLSGRTPIWSTSDAAVATVTAAGVVTGVAVGAATVTAVVEGMSGSSSVTVTAAAVDACDPSYVVPSQPALPGGIDVTVQRRGTACGTLLVSSAIPLMSGALTAAQMSQLRLFVGGKEQALYVEPLQGTHAGGSLRAVLVQFNYSLAAGKPVPGQLVLGEARGTVDIVKPTASRTNPVAVVLPTSPDYLVGTQIVGPTLTVAAASQVSATVQQYQSNFPLYADKLWTSEGAMWEGNFYDRALIYYAWWARTGNVEYWRRGTSIALSYRRDYLELNNYQTSAHWSQIEGIELHYLLTGDGASRTAVGRVGDVFNVEYYMADLGNLGGPLDNRIQARTLMALLTSWKLNAPTQTGSVWGTLLPDALNKILSSQDAAGAYRFTNTAQCGYNKPWMVGLLNDALIKYYTSFSADARIPTAIQKANDYMWANDWDAASKNFVYLDGPCPEDEGGPMPDLNNLIVNGFAWTYQRTGNTVYRDRADEIFAGAVANDWLDGSKQFNQHYTSSYRYLAYRQ
jgi:hypothetical protein